MRLGAATVAAVVMFALPAQAYYHYIHYASRNAPFTPIYEKFDVNTLPNKTVTFFVSDQQPVNYAANDSFGAVLSQVRQALAVWNDVSTSELRVAFGGIESQTQLLSNTPGGDVTFVDLGPGVLGMGGPISSPISNGAFFPIAHSVVMLNRDLSVDPGPSYLEEFFTTAVHEVGHALGLQHTWTGSAMSQGVIRNTSRTRPLDADDIAGLSVLYGKPGWAVNYGSISGRVTFANGLAVNMASVVAISANGGPAVSALTDPNGAYRIDGLPPNAAYKVYVHPLPPDAIAGGEGVRLPVDANNGQFPPSGAFQTVFFAGGTGTLDPDVATSITVGAGPVGGVNFSVQPRGSVTAYDIVTYSKLDSTARSYMYSGNLTVTPAFLSTTQNQPGLIIAQAPVNTPALQSASILGPIGATRDQIQYFSLLQGSPLAAAIYFRSTFGAGVGPRHLVLNYGSDIYVLPNAVNLVQKGPPLIGSATANPDGTVTVAGAGLGSDSSVYFDGLKANWLSFTGSEVQGSIVVQPPPGASGQTATITVYNPDGQNSMILLGISDGAPGQPRLGIPPTYTYPVTAGAPQITAMNFAALPAGSSASIDIATANMNLVDGQVTVGFGSDDIAVRRVWVQGTHVIANVYVSPGAALGSSEISIISGFQVLTAPTAFTVQAARPGFPLMFLPVLNADSTQQTIYPGSTVAIYGVNLAAPGLLPTVTLNDQPVQVVFPTQTSPAGSAQVNFVVPLTIVPGLATLKVNNGAQTSFGVTVQIDAAPPTIVAVVNASNQPVNFPVGTGDVLAVVVRGLDPTVLNNPSRLQVTIAGTPMQLVGINSLPDGTHQIQFMVTLTQSLGGAQVPLMVWVDGSSSPAVGVLIR